MRCPDCGHEPWNGMMDQYKHAFCCGCRTCGWSMMIFPIGGEHMNNEEMQNEIVRIGKELNELKSKEMRSETQRLVENMESLRTAKNDDVLDPKIIEYYRNKLTILIANRFDSGIGSLKDNLGKMISVGEILKGCNYKMQALDHSTIIAIKENVKSDQVYVEMMKLESVLGVKF